MPTAKVNGININYRVVGQGEPLVMIMGFAADQSGWMFQVPAFKKYYQVITFDNRGVGKSDKPQGPYTPKIMAEDTVQLMDHLNIKRAHILGISMGGVIAQEIAINYPERVMKLILGCTWSCDDDGANGGTPLCMEAKKLPIRQFAAYVTDAATDKPFFRWFLLPTLKLRFKLMKEPEAAGLIGQHECITGYNSLDRLPLIKSTTLVITGTDDRVIKSTSSETIAKNILNARLVKIDKGSHLVNGEMSSVYNKEVLSFLRAG